MPVFPNLSDVGSPDSGILAGRTTAGAGPLEEITPGTGLVFSGLGLLVDTSVIATISGSLATFLAKASNLSDLTDASVARSNLGLGTLATQSGTFSGTHSGSSSGTNTGDQTSVTGNAGTATALQTPRNINGVAFDGTANITVTAAAGTLTGTTLNATVVTSSLTAVGTIATGIWNGTTITVDHGGTGAITLASNGVLYGNGTGAVQALAVNASATTKFLTQASSAAPSWFDLFGTANTWTAQNTFAAGTITTSQPLTVTQTWNDGAVTFNGLLVNCTATASAAASTVMDFQVGGTSLLRTRKDGLTVFKGGISMDDSIIYVNAGANQAMRPSNSQLAIPSRLALSNNAPSAPDTNIDRATGGGFSFTSPVRTSGSVAYFQVLTPADTPLTASQESIGMRIGGSSASAPTVPATVTRTFATGAYAGLQREYVFTHPTYNTVGSSSFTGATLATVAIVSAPVIGGNITGTPATIALLVGTGVATGIGLELDAAGSQTGQLFQTRNAAGNIRASISAAGDFTNSQGTTAGSNSSEYFGLGAIGLGIQQLAVGHGATVGTGTGSCAIGHGASTGTGGAVNTNALAVGTSASATNLMACSFGAGTVNAQQGSIAIGSIATTTAAQQLVIGSTEPTLDRTYINSVYIGSGVTSATPKDVTYSGTGGSGNNIAGAILTIRGGIPTGTSVVGGVKLQAGGGAALASGASVNTPVTVVEVTPGATLGKIGFFAATPVTQQSIAAVATDAATVITLANSLRTAVLNLGLGV